MISLGWHVFWMLAVSIVITPTKLELSSFPSVFFLGPILEDNALVVGFSGADKRAEKIEYHRKIFSPSSEVSLSVAHPDLVRDETRSFPKKAERAFWHLFQMAGMVVKGSERETSTDIPDREEDAAYKNLPFTLEGDIDKRKVVYRPAPPRYQELLEGIGMDFDIVMRLSVGPDGTVLKVEKLNSTGSAHVDTVTIRYVRRWMFESSGDGSIYEGILRFKPEFY